MNDLLASSIPGRVRLRGARLRSPVGLDGLQRRLQVQPGIVSVRTNARVGSVLIQYDPVRLSQPELLGRLQPLLEQHLPEPRADVPDAAAGEGRGPVVDVRQRRVQGQGLRETAEDAAGEQAAALTEVAASAQTQTPWKGWWALRAGAASEQAGKHAARPPATEPQPSSQALPPAAPRARKWNWKKTANQVAKQGMLLSLGSSLGLVAAGAKKGHAVTGSAFVGLLGVHLAIHRKSLFK